MSVEGRKLPVSVSVGTCLSTADRDDGRILLGLADKAMYRAKRNGGNGFHLCNSEASTNACALSASGPGTNQADSVLET